MNITKAVWIGTIGIGIAIYFSMSLLVPKKPVAVPVATFEEQLAEQKRQADVASQLRAAERGYLTETIYGNIEVVANPRHAGSGDGDIALCNSIYDCNISKNNRPISLEVKRIKRVVRPTDHDWGEISFLFLRGERTK